MQKRRVRYNSASPFLLCNRLALQHHLVAFQILLASGEDSDGGNEAGEEGEGKEDGGGAVATGSGNLFKAGGTVDGT
jgi:hypothetical protein